MEIEKASVLVEALPYIKKYYGKTVVIKYGGKAMGSNELKESIATDIVLLKFVGINPVVIHGGGPEITAYMDKLEKKVEFVEGLRVTDKETMEIVKMVLVGKINKELVSLINRHGKLAVGVSGEDGLLILAKKHQTASKVDLGHVGDVDMINTDLLERLTGEEYIPVVASVGVDMQGNSYNINADDVAGELAAALKADKLIFLTDVAGIYGSLDDQNSLISELSLADCEHMVNQKVLSEGMIPKVRGCVKALRAGVKRAHIIDGQIKHALLLEVFTDRGIGTMITG